MTTSPMATGGVEATEASPGSVLLSDVAVMIFPFEVAERMVMGLVEVAVTSPPAASFG